MFAHVTGCVIKDVLLVFKTEMLICQSKSDIDAEFYLLKSLAP